ncbi:TIGR02530 family flagellar biosynthesis protein [Halalkalibacterium ligniniphilum]|uniref:TIGR02530 family flagellar biosynthesis protein n=1 Tax=Halalkalibacterium ligniniphilum TaxID=1134413 RepID=UPI00034BA8E0|nr:TIGR02530 family flagellar biosynthesis protein [Halalkalibacterium ligniniphilum]
MDPRIGSTSIHSLQQLHALKKRPQIREKQIETFSNLLQAELAKPEKLKLSKHAEQRMEARGITMTEATWMRISKKVAEAKDKGLQETLVLTNEAALVVSARNQTVITALDRQEAKDQIFTNINGTIIIDE